MKEKIKKTLYTIANIILTISITLTGILLVIVIGFLILIHVRSRGYWIRIKKPTFEQSNQTIEKMDKIFERVYTEVEKNAGKD